MQHVWMVSGGKLCELAKILVKSFDLDVWAGFRSPSWHTRIVDTCTTAI
jgi:hypothetical protein